MLKYCKTRCVVTDRVLQLKTGQVSSIVFLTDQARWFSLGIGISFSCTHILLTQMLVYTLQVNYKTMCCNSYFFTSRKWAHKRWPKHVGGLCHLYCNEFT